MTGYTRRKLDLELMDPPGREPPRRRIDGVDLRPVDERHPTYVEPLPEIEAHLPRPPPAPRPPPLPLGERRQRTLAELVLRWRQAPWLFVREELKAVPDLWQDEVLHAVVGKDLQGNPLPEARRRSLLALKACKGPGKTTVLAWIMWWFLLCFTDAKVVATSITGENLRDGLWTEAALWRSKSKILDHAFEWQTERIFLRERPETWFASARTWPKDADRSKQAATLAGIHARHTLLLMDESGDIPEGVLAAGLAHHSTQDPSGREVHLTVQAGNPTRLDGALGIACTRDRDKWWVKEITGDPQAPDRAPRMDIGWCQQQIDTWGENNPWVMVNVFGRFPPTQDNKLLGPEAVRAAMSLVIEEKVWRARQRVAGLDVARSLAADRSALCRRQGPVVFPFKIWRLDDAQVLTSQVAYELEIFKPQAVFVDATGIGGPVADGLRSLGFNVVMVYFGHPARDRRFADKRTEIWWEMAQEIKGTGGVGELALPELPELVTDLTGPEIIFNDRGQVKLESKEHMKRRGLSSPDLGDALAMTWAEPLMFDQARVEEPKEMVAWTRAKGRDAWGEAVMPQARGGSDGDYDPFAG